MEIHKNINSYGQDELIIGDKPNRFVMCYGGSDFYWVLEDHRLCNRFVISKEDKDLYLIFKSLFKDIKKSDNKYCPTIKNNVFEWVSEAGLPEISNKLLITKEENKFVIDFVKNPNDIVGLGMCAICFCLSGSRNAEIVYNFAMMFQNYIAQKEQPKILKK